MIDRTAFFHSVRRTVFGGSLTKGQVEGMEKIIDYWQSQWPRMSVDEFAYVLATVFWETAHRMVPVKEMGGEAYLRSKKYWPYIGVGLVQVTWRGNWDKFGIKSVADGLSWPTALRACFEGMVRGMYTGKKLADYIGNGRRDYVNARRIINGTDRAHEIARIAESFRRALIDAARRDEPIPTPIPTPVEPADNYALFREYLIRALREDEEIRAIVMEIIFPEEPAVEGAAPDENDEPHPEYGMDQSDEVYSDDDYTGTP